MKWIQFLVIAIILLGICVIAPAASWDIGAVQLEGGATDIGAVQASAAIGATYSGRGVGRGVGRGIGR